MEEFKSALKAQCNDNFAQCNVISCETRVWKTSFPNKAHICHGNTYDDLLAYYAPKHAAQIADMTKAIAKAHNDYADMTSSKGGHSGGTPKANINASVKTLFDSVVYPTYMKNKEVFDNCHDNAVTDACRVNLCVAVREARSYLFSTPALLLSSSLVTRVRYTSS